MKNIALFTSYTGKLEVDFHAQILAPFTEFAKKEDINLLMYIGGIFNSPYTLESMKTVLFDQIDWENIDGLVILTNMIGSYLDQKELKKLIEKYASIPLINIGIPLEEIPTVQIDNITGMRHLLLHMIREHGYKRLVFLRGPTTAYDLRERFLTYVDVLKSEGLPLDMNLVVDGGGYWFPSGSNAVRILLDERKVRFDAIIAATDMLAHGAIEELTKRGIRVPEDIPVTGFDNSSLSKDMTPHLTTVEQPFYEQGYTGITYLYNYLTKKEPIPLKTELPSRLIIQNSCGCLEAKKSEDPEKILPIPHMGDILRTHLTDTKTKLNDLSFALQLARDLDHYGEILQNWLPRLGFENFYLSIYKDPNQPNGEREFIAGMAKQKKVPVDRTAFSGERLLPQGVPLSFNRTGVLCTVPLFYGKRQMGFVLFDFLSWEINIYEELVEILNGTLIPVIHKEALEEYEREIKQKQKQVHKIEADYNRKVKKLTDTIVNPAALSGEELSEDLRVQRAISYINNHYDKNLTLEQVASEAFVAPTYFSAVFKKAMGMGFAHYIQELRIKAAKALLKKEYLKVSEIAGMVGFRNANYFIKVFKHYTGQTPQDYRHK